MTERKHVLASQFADSLRTVNEACDALRIRPTKCWELIKTGDLEAVRLGRRSTRIKKSSIDRLIARGVLA
jgi:excisionase family DNA binding protein